MTKILINEILVEMASPYAEVEHDNPDGTEYGRRNYGETGYMSASDDLAPGYDPYHDYRQG